ncbi:type II toxin-antitoxin system PemK/MazF family toxin [Candidatus Poriferisodalis sp.]|uniref:type II toxin-antitoxin system PemK/MazF family toxin n=1 Tax=Candidatus Poriferisodalis sp. TaxID=3101277 RepID=UPI003B02B420
MSDRPRRGDVYLCELDPVVGSEIRKTRPVLVVSPDVLNDHWRSCLVAPMTTGSHPYPFRVDCRFRGTAGHVVVDQMRAVDTARMVRKLGRLSSTATARVLAVAREMFAD